MELPPGSRRILITTDTAGGVWTFTAELARELGARGHQILLAAFGEPSPWQAAEAQSIPGLHAQFLDAKLEWMPDPWEDLARARGWLRDLETEFEPDVVHLNSFGHVDSDWRTPTVLTVHSCVASWWIATKRSPLPETWKSYRDVVRDAILTANAVCAPTHAMADAVQESYGTSSVHVKVIWNGRSGRPATRTKESFVFSAGRLWDEGKNAATLASIAHQLPWPVYFAGPQGDAFGSRTELPGSRTLGTLPPAQLAEWLERSAIFASPARYEPFGYSVLEAAQAGCALVLGDIPSLRELWDDAAAFVPPNDPVSLLEAIRGLIAQPQWMGLMGLRARLRSRGFTAGRMADGYEEVYAMTMDRAAACAS